MVDLTLIIEEPGSYSARAFEGSISRSGGPRYFDTLESLFFRGPFFLIQHLLGLIDSSCLKSFYVSPLVSHVLNNEHEPDDLFTPSMTIISSKWAQFLEKLQVDIEWDNDRYPILKSLLLLTDLHVLQTFCLSGWRMEN